MRILAWNLNHRTQRRSIPDAVPRGLLALEPDLLVLTEYVEGPDHRAFAAELARGGLPSTATTASSRGHNQVMIASRLSLEPGAVMPPPDLPHASNFLHVTAGNIDVFGVRGPIMPPAINRRAFWTWLESAVAPYVARSAVMIGDLNADPCKPRNIGTPSLARLATAGWQIPVPDGPWSYLSHRGTTSRLDHAPVSPALGVESAAYVTEHSGVRFAGTGSAGLSDHALLVLKLAVPRA